MAGRADPRCPDWLTRATTADDSWSTGPVQS